MAPSEEFIAGAIGGANALRAEFSSRYSSFRGELFDRFLTGPLPVFLDGLGGGDLGLVESYLRLVAEGIRLGILPAPLAAGEKPRSFAQLALSRLVPTLLPRLPRKKQAELLAKLWNLSENLASAPRFLEAVLSRSLADLETLEGLEERLEAATSRVLAPRLSPIGATPKALWIDLSEEDQRFLPGQVHFLNPVVACVHDRARGSSGGRPASTCGVWMTDPPSSLGPSGCNEDPGPSKLVGGPMWRALAARDPRFSEVLDTAVSESRGVATLVTSQWAVLLLPEREKVT